MTRARLEAAFVAHRAGRLAEAAAGYAAVLAADPDDADALNLFGVLRRAEGALAEALDLLARAVGARPGHADAWYNFGNALAAAADRPAAADAYRQVIALDPNRAAAHASLGVVLGEMQRLDEAAAAYGAALRLDPEHIIARHNLGNLSCELGRPREATAHLRRVAAAHSDLAEARYNLAHAALRLGDYTAGFRLYEWRWKAPGFVSPRFRTDLPEWSGAPFPGLNLLIHAEQGLGDTLQFLRFLPLVKSLGGTVSLLLPRSLTTLAAGVAGADRILGEGADLAGHDLVVPLMSLPARLGLTLGSIPRAVPYLHADPARVALWRDRLGDDGRRLVAVVWRGNPQAAVDRGRSLPGPDALAPLAAIPGVRLIALQKLDAADLVADDAGGWRVAAAPFLDHPGPSLDAGPDAFLDSAAILTLAEQVVTTDTALAHLAGALARPTLLMLREPPDWRWMLERTDTPWYPTMELVRQTRLGDRAGVIDRVVQRLADGG